MNDKRYIEINGKSYRVASNCMGVTLGLLEVFDGAIPEMLGPREMLILMGLSIYWGEYMDGRESDFSQDAFCTMEAREGQRILNEFRTIYDEQNPGAGKKKA